jgi:hypothetical protein
MRKETPAMNAGVFRFEHRQSRLLHKEHDEKAKATQGRNERLHETNQTRLDSLPSRRTCGAPHRRTLSRGCRFSDDAVNRN